MATPQISFVIPTYGRAEYLKDLISSIRKTTPAGFYEIVIVSSDDPQCEKVLWLKQQPDVKLILADHRQRGRRSSIYKYINLGVYQTKFPWVYVVNDDMLLDAAWYREFAGLLGRPGNEDLGLVVVAAHLGSMVGEPRVATFGKGRKIGGQWQDLYISDFSIIRKDVLEKIGNFDENLNWYGSGADNTLAAMFLANAKIAVDDKIKITHFVASELRQDNGSRAFYDFNYLIRKWRGLEKKLGLELDIKFGVRPYTWWNRFRYFIKDVIKII